MRSPPVAEDVGEEEAGCDSAANAALAVNARENKVRSSRFIDDISLVG